MVNCQKKYNLFSLSLRFLCYVSLIIFCKGVKLVNIFTNCRVLSRYDINYGTEINNKVQLL